MGFFVTNLATSPQPSKLSPVCSAFKQPAIHKTLQMTTLISNQLTRQIDHRHLPASTKRIKHVDYFLGQHRAKHALELGLAMPYKGYHICAIGVLGLGKRSMIQRYLTEYVQSLPAADEWVYVYNVKQPKQPKLLRFPAGQIQKFTQELTVIWQTLFNQSTAQTLTTQSILSLFNPLIEHFPIEGVSEYLTTYRQQIIDYFEQHKSLPEIYSSHQDLLSQLPVNYQLRPLIEQSCTTPLPIVYEPYPTLQRLFGLIDHNLTQGSLTSHLQNIHVGALQRANGGFLILELEQLLQQPQVWSLLKLALKQQVFQWSTLQHLTSSPHLHLQPEDIPLNVKVILLTQPETYDEVLFNDPELSRLFKIRADFTDILLRTPEHEQAYVQLIADYIQQYQLLPFDRGALAVILTDASHQAEDQNVLSLHGATLSDLLKESNYYALQQQAKMVTAHHVQTALKQRLYRLGYWRELYWQDLSQGTQLIETKGYRLGQVNALSIIQYADVEFGFPSRLTASVCQGAGDILDIERSVELGGSLHAKGTLLMSSFLKAHFGRQQLLNFSAALAFEQSYGEVDGDSATVAELCALISAISQIPIDQSWAITGSMNQLGQVQPVGGINTKIEGFFDTCQLYGLTGEQGVIIPRQNTQHLMLRQDIIDAVQHGHFHIHAIDTIDQALELLMARPVGVLNTKGEYTSGSIYEAVMNQLQQWQEGDTLIELEASNQRKKKKNKKKKKEKTALDQQAIDTQITSS